MAFDIQEFKSIVNHNGGLKRANHFLVEFPVPRGLTKVITPFTGGSNGILSYYCKTAVLPGIGILTQDIYRYGYGPIERKPYGTIVNDAMVAVYIDGNNRVRTWFNHWTRLVVNSHTERGIMSMNSVNAANAYEFEYKQNYAVDIRVSAFDPEGNETTRVVLVEAWPNFIGDIMVDWDAKNTHMIMPISLTFRDWYEETIDSPRVIRNVTVIDDQTGEQTTSTGIVQ